MSEYIDISMPVDDWLPTWPGSPGVRTTQRLALANNDEANVTQLEMDVHSGTHVDAPLHFVPDGASLETIGLHPFVGPALVADTGDAKEITGLLLESLTIPPATERLLLRTRNSAGPRRTAEFDADYAALTLDGGRWVGESGLKLVGIDYLSIQRFEDSPETHRAILGQGVCILEGLLLNHVLPGAYDLVCLPIRLSGPEAAPARAILRPTERTR